MKRTQVFEDIRTFGNCPKSILGLRTGKSCQGTDESDAEAKKNAEMRKLKDCQRNRRLEAPAPG